MKSRSERSRTRIVETARIHVEASRDNAERLQLILPKTDAPVVPTHWAFGQLASLVGAPAAYLRQLPAPLAGINLQYGLASHRAEQIKTFETAICCPDAGRCLSRVEAAGANTLDATRRSIASAGKTLLETITALNAPDTVVAIGATSDSIRDRPDGADAEGLRLADGSTFSHGVTGAKVIPCSRGNRVRGHPYLAADKARRGRMGTTATVVDNGSMVRKTSQPVRRSAPCGAGHRSAP